MTKPTPSRRPGWRPLLATGGLLATASLVAMAAGAGAQTPTSNRLSGPNRYATAGAVATADFGTTHAPIAVIASGTNYPDALAANYLAGRIHGPVLLTDPTSLSPETLTALQAIKATGVDLVGGTAAVSDNVATQLKSQGYTVNRLFGNDRYGTAQAIDETFPATFVGDLGADGPTAIVTTGLGFADALAAGGMSYAGAFPLVLTDPSTLPAESQDVLTKLQIKTVVIVGGLGAVSTTVQDQIEGLGITVIRIAGQDRTDTALQLAEKIEIPMLGFTNTKAVLARGDDYADALAGGALAGLAKAPVVLTETPDILGTYTTNWFASHNSTMATIDVVGGTTAVSDQTVEAAQTAATPPPTTTTTSTTTTAG